MPGELPKLTRPQMARLVEIGDADAGGKSESGRNSPITTARLLDMGLIERRAIRQTPTGRILAYRIWVKGDGVRVLAGLPGEEFDRFRDMVREATDA